MGPRNDVPKKWIVLVIYAAGLIATGILVAICLSLISQ